jgi:aspartate racemase
MKTIGIIGGITWESTIEYYRVINTLVHQELGGYHSAKCIIHSVDFAEVEQAQHAGNWTKVTNILTEAANGLEKAGADFLIIATNTLHKVADEVQNAISIPIIHIADATAKEVKAQGLKTVGLLGTSFTMEESFYTKRFNAYDVNILVPNKRDRELINKTIFEELCFGKVNETSKVAYMKIIEKLKENGAEAVILGCTEIGFLVTNADADVPLFDTVQIHAREAVRRAITT